MQEVACTTSSLPPTLPVNFDMARVIAGVNKYFNPHREEFLLSHHVSDVKDGYAYVSFAIPEQMVSAFISTLENFARMFKMLEVKVKSVSAQTRVRNISLNEIERRKQAQKEMEYLVCSRYDKYIAKGSSRNEAISLTNKELKQNFSWAYYEGVKDIVRSSGRFRKCKINSKERT